MQSHKRGSAEGADQHPHLRLLVQLKSLHAVLGSASPDLLVPGQQSHRVGSGG